MVAPRHWCQQTCPFSNVRRFFFENNKLMPLPASCCQIEWPHKKSYLASWGFETLEVQYSIEFAFCFARICLRSSFRMHFEIKILSDVASSTRTIAKSVLVGLATPCIVNLLAGFVLEDHFQLTQSFWFQFMKKMFIKCFRRFCCSTSFVKIWHLCFVLFQLKYFSFVFVTWPDVQRVANITCI